MICVKDFNVFQGIIAKHWHLQLTVIFGWICSRWPESIVLTDGFRFGDTGVHGTDPLRGIDLRSRKFDDPQTVADEINAFWQYDFLRKEKLVCLYHKTRHGAWHFHIQVHPNTRRRPDGLN